MLGFAGGYLALVSHGFAPGVGSRVLLGVAVLSLAFGSVLVILHTHGRYEEIRRYMDSVQPGFIKFTPIRKTVRPHHVMIVLIAVLSVVVCSLIAIYPSLPAFLTCSLHWLSFLR
jgi:hypothetical protein